MRVHDVEMSNRFKKQIEPFVSFARITNGSKLWTEGGLSSCDISIKPSQIMAETKQSDFRNVYYLGRCIIISVISLY